MHEHVNIHILLSLLWGCVHTAVCEKCLVHRGECVTTGGLYRPNSPVCSTLRIAQKSFIQLFIWCDKVGGCLGRWSMFQEVGVCMGFQRGAG